MFMGVSEILVRLNSLDGITDQNIDTEPLQRACAQGEGIFSSASSCLQMIARASVEEHLALRAGALCYVLGSCDPSDNCRIEQPGGEAQSIAMDFCTTDGTVNGRLVGARTAEPEEGACFEDADCSSQAACTWSEDVESVLECQTNGLDEVKAQGECRSPCETARVQNLIQSRSSAFMTCQSNDDCEDGSVCRQAPESCKIYSCNPATGQVVASECSQTCQAATIQLAGAKFSNDGNIIVNLTSQAKDYSGDCRPVFEASTTQMLGSSAECTTHGQEMQISLKGDATVVTGDLLRLRASQNTLINKVDSLPFEGSSRPISTCSRCDVPQAIIEGPTALNEQCNPSSEVVKSFSGAASSGPGDRPFTSVLWSLVSAPAGGEVPSLLEALSDANDRSSLILELDSTIVNELPEGEYTLSFRVDSFLGTSDVAEHSFTKKSGNTSPSVSIAASDAPYSKGISLEVSVSTQDVLCSGNQAEFLWSCILERSEQELECTVLDGIGVRARSSLFIPSRTLAASGIMIGDRLIFKLSASYVGVATSTNVFQSVTVLGDELIARLEGPSGDVQIGGDNVIVFSAEESEDPSDPFDTLAPMRYQFGCERLKDELKPCFKDINYFGAISGSQWLVNTSQFVQADDEYYMQVTVLKGTEGQSRRTASALKIVVPRSQPVVQASISRFCPRSAQCPAKHASTNPLALTVSVQLENANGLDTTTARYRWSYPSDQVERLGVQLDNSNTESGVENEDLIILPGQAQPSSGSLIVQCQITLADGSQSFSVISVPISSPPICGSTEGCLRLPRTERTFPDNTFVANAVGWSSASPLRFEFGLISEDGSYKIWQPVSRKRSFTFRAQVGSHRPYVCAYDISGGKACEDSSFVLRPADYTAQQLVASLQDVSFEALLGTGDDDSVWDAIQDIVSRISAVSSELSQEDQSFVESVLEDARAAIASVSNSEVANAGTGISSINSENDLSRQEVGNASRLLQNTAVGLRLLERAEDALLDLDTAANALENTKRAGGSNDNSARARALLGNDARDKAHRMDANFASIGRQLASQTLPGSTIQIQRDSVSLATLKASTSRMSKEEVSLTTGASGSASVGFPGQSFASWCSNDAGCRNQDLLSTIVMYLEEAGPYVDATTNLLEALQDKGAKDIGIVSGVLEAQLSYEGKRDQLLCDASTEECQLVLQFPINMDRYDASKSHTCMRIVPGANAYQALRVDSFAATPSTDDNQMKGSCTSSGLGKHVIIQYTASAGDEDELSQEERARSKAFDVFVTVGISVNDTDGTTQMSTHVASEQLMTDISQALVSGLYRMNSDLMGDSRGQQCSECVKATKLEALDSGSTLVTLAVHLPDDASSEDKEEFKADILDASISTILSDSQFADEIIGLRLDEQSPSEVELQPEPSPGPVDEDKDSGSNNQDTAVIGGAVGGAVGGTIFFLSVAAVAYYIRKRRAHGAEQKQRKLGAIAPEPPARQSTRGEPNIPEITAPFSPLAGPPAEQPAPLVDLEEGKRDHSSESYTPVQRFRG
ncbi:hypothetical protein DUNSADRAFT_6080 [Dunaliella salina]|uniref:PKD/REJ-like domain-containing protein n=1 Tax=Dunaliella salina TaxID=3046 RepID=A0ABQ7H6Y0_DUNSA|nr:hypothetical protein DUNSADRAFT_6080 [Dunaliella salina]|eukprot:KAF5842611.1 hypothetical protein DUNSADRAFT_6080 [Dunaliella salina]